MAYCFAKGDASVEDGFRRIAGELFDKAIGLVDEVEADPQGHAQETIHVLRKQCKKLRGLYRLVRPAFPGYADENAAVREAAKVLSSARDAEVLVDTFDRLVKRANSPPTGVTEVRRRLVARYEELARGQSAAAAFSDFRAAIAAARKRVRRTRLDERGFDTLAEGLERSFAGARKAMRRARKEGDPEAFHEWRKRVKDHWYHARLLAPIWPGMLQTHVKVAEDLGELLGLHHDISVFRERIEDMAEGDAATAAFLDGLAAEREAEIARECFSLGARLLAEKPGALARRWRAWWKCWREEQRASALEAAE